VNTSRDTRSFKAATYVLNVTVDYKNEIAELNETNNRFTMELSLAEEEVHPPVLSVGEPVLEGELREGFSVNIVAQVGNSGEGDARAVTVSFVIDGKVAGTVLLDEVKAGANRTAAFLWKPSAGKHGISVKAEASGANTAASPLKQFSVAEPKTTAGQADLTMPIVAVVIVIAVAAGAGVFLLRRKKGAGPAQ